MKYNISISSGAQKQFRKFPNQIQDAIIPKMLHLEKNPRPHGVQKLRNSEYYRIRVNDYRIIYSINDKLKTVVILDINHRKDAYR
ncbi:MAG TPA: type II toxin-antitoxin system RelE/ParE family toxin [Candidatus Omnitrophota bacterium]|nr:type II toxin-antitoxin system RelE/ParE family toxin [Candidatus Omnitrophota bacterium]